MPLDLCGTCPDPGSCCRDIRLHGGGEAAQAVLRGGTRLEALVLMASVHPADGESGLPFVPAERDVDGWRFECPLLTPEGRCGGYEDRPHLCRFHKPGLHLPCAWVKPAPLAPFDPTKGYWRRLVGEERASRDRLTPAQRSRLMSRICGEGTAPERMLEAALDRAGVAYGTHAKDLPGRPDVVLRGAGLAVFVGGDFWHGWRFAAWRGALTPFWEAKIERNMARDRRVGRELRAMGWRVLRLWEHQVRSDADACARRVVREASARSPSRPAASPPREADAACRPSA